MIKSYIGTVFVTKAVIGGPAGPASAGPLFWPSMLSAVPLFFFYFSLFLLCLSVKLFNRIIKSAAFNACFVMQLSITLVARFTCKLVQGVITKQSQVVPNTAIIIMTPV